MSSGRFEHDPAGRHSTEVALKVSHMLLNRIAEPGVAGHTLKIDLD
jgi:hypothetical protein